MVLDASPKEWSLDIFEKQGTLAGVLKLTTQLVPVEPDPPLYKSINYNCYLEIKMVSAEFLKDEGDAIGK